MELKSLLHFTEKLALLLTEKGKTLALAESCTGGLMACILTSRPGSSLYFMFSAVTYANLAKEKVLGVRRETLMQYGAVSEAVAREMAMGARIQGSADLGLSVTGIAGPDGGSADKPVGTFCVGLADEKNVFSWRFQEDQGGRDANRRQFAFFAFDRLYEHLQKESEKGL
ncbi:CinA family protein [Desulfococcaceae bacterium OttesenSCG-928-F15]|nr:CinA family protein [Desulfococcaceae bacterium OttesenSCG-928-F15]